MPYSTISTAADGGTLTAGHCNTLENNAEFLYAIAHQANWPCPSVHRNSVDGFDQDNHRYTFRHQLRYLQFLVWVLSGSLIYARLFYAGHKVWGNEAPSGSFSGYADLNDLTTWPNYNGAWITAHSYDATALGDGDLVSQSGVFYKCKLDHSSAATTQPGIGATWNTVWNVVSAPALGAWCSSYFQMHYLDVGELAIDYLFEDSETA